MRDALDNIRDINFHIDAENDEDQPPTSERLPSREDIRAVLARHIGELPSHSRLRLHYLKNKVDQLRGYPWFGSIRVWVAGEP